MRAERTLLLTFDSLINALLGLALFAFPTDLPTVLGLPETESGFYASILGAVLLGIGIALFIEVRRGSDGLGVRGAIAINLLGGGALVAWLLSGLDLPLRGVLVLWAVAVCVLGLTALEWWRALANGRST